MKNLWDLRDEREKTNLLYWPTGNPCPDTTRVGALASASIGYRSFEERKYAATSAFGLALCRSGYRAGRGPG